MCREMRRVGGFNEWQIKASKKDHGAFSKRVRFTGKNKLWKWNIWNAFWLNASTFHIGRSCKPDAAPFSCWLSASYLTLSFAINETTAAERTTQAASTPESTVVLWSQTISTNSVVLKCCKCFIRAPGQICSSAACFLLFGNPIYFSLKACLSDETSKGRICPKNTM